MRNAAGDEALVIRALEPGALAAMDVVFFAASEATTRKHWKEAQGAGAAIVDLSGALEGKPGARIASPWIASAVAPDLLTLAVVPAHPAALMLALVSTRLRARFEPLRLVVTLHEPASQHGSAALDELQKQTVALLSFQGPPRDVFDQQIAFNLAVEVGPEAKIYPAENERQIREHFAAFDDGAKLALQVVLAPVFHGYTASAYVELGRKATAAEVRDVLRGTAVRLTDRGDETPRNETATGQADVMIDVRELADNVDASEGFWLWMAADNLRLAAQNAAACAAELVKLRPARPVQ